ncbi:hypothetical protein L6R52_23805 [Myxococcota bacterium]|nr:hypothetical protein [Myxococcota bacterium]
MQTNRLQNGQLGSISNVQGADALSGANLEAQLAQLLSGGSMDVAGLGITKALNLRSQAIGIATGMMHAENDSTRRVIDSMST